MTPERWRRIKEVFQEAVELAPADRPGYLASQTAGDPDLSHEVERMLRHAGDGGLLDTPACEAMPVDSALDAGTRLGPYEIAEQVGAGGMGRVYKARDTRLGRTVAIKVLNAEFSHRLRLEGRAISALNHPHVCALHDIGDQDGAAYLVMEFVEGAALSAALAHGPLPYDAVLRYGSQIADALAAAHTHGIVHRDLKPANIMIVGDGVKVLDFGVARMAQEEETAAGGLVGTAAYMSPSQLNGNTADARSDIFALGLVLCEMATGRRPASGATPNLDGVPSGLAGVIRRCLQHHSADRFPRMDDVRDALQRVRAESAAPRSRFRPVPVGIACAVVIVGAAIVVANWKKEAPPRRDSPVATVRTATQAVPVTPPVVATPRPVVKTVAQTEPPEPPPPPTLETLAAYPGLERDPSLSPDGSKVAFSWTNPPSGGYAIYVRPVKGDERPVALTGGMVRDWGPAWSPDGRRIAFRRVGERPGIYWVPAAGGPESMLAPIAPPLEETLPQMSWSRDGKWIAAPDRDSNGTRIYLFSTLTGEKHLLTSNSGGIDHAPAFSPDGKSLAYTSCRGSATHCDIYVIALDKQLTAANRRQVTDEADYVRGVAWLPNGRGLVYAAGKTNATDTFLWRVSVNPPGLPERIDLAGVRAHHPTLSADGRLLAYTRMQVWHLMLIDHFR